MRETRLWPYVLVFIAGATWGVTFSLARLATAGGAHPLGLTFWQAFGGGLTLLLVYGIRGNWLIFRRRHLSAYLAIGILGSVLPASLYFYAAPHVPAGLLAITVATVPLMTYGASWMLGIDHLSVARAAGLVVGLLAVLVLVAPETSLPDPAMTAWVLVALLASLCYTAENIYVERRVSDDADIGAVLTGALLAAGVMLLPVVLYLDVFVSLTVAWTRTEWSIVAMAIISSLAYMLYLMVLKTSGAVFASQTGYVVTLAGVAWGMVIFGERHSAWVWLSLTLMMIGLGLVTPRERILVPATDDAHAIREINRPF